MSLAIPTAANLSPPRDPPRVVLCGSFRRDQSGLRQAFDALSDRGCELLSPVSLDFVAEVDGFVLSEREIDDEPSAIEERHVAALRAADFVWLHVADGYVGPSAALEVGVAHALGIPVYSARRPLDRTIAEFVTTMPSIDATVARVVASGAYAPALPLRDLQEYYKRMAAIRGFTEETPQDTMLLLTEEVGELARSVRHRVALARSGTSSNDPGEELADVQLYLLHLANVLKIDLATAVASKERVNHDRYGRVSVPDAA